MWTRASALLLLACCLWAVEGQNENGNGYTRAGNGGGVAATATAENRKGVWEDPIQFNNKAKDLCTMSVTGQGDVTKLRISCQGAERTYWCEYTGKPQMCRAYNNNPRHYFTQIMWDLRKLQNACQAPKAIKPQMCKRAPEDAQMLYSASSTPEAASAATPQKPEKAQEPTQAKPETPKAPIVKQAKPAATKPEQARPEQVRPEPAKPEARPAPTKPVQSRPVQAKPEQARPAAAKPAGAKPAGAKPAVNKTAVLKKLLTPKPTTPKPTKPTVKGNAKKIAQEYCWQSLQGICSYVIGWFQN
ncbi:fibroblast growth factor-binding protein 2-like [Oncorhynchus kisutch]|uniref:fibroblast growth factor-binding protein 2-like n=1 Tax=Oncorhynchus kisutch TaxID=8019 RepID=UPI0009A00D15|nr:fibroblast growth factor-binding protein 2-like [Oncorhynchus kisutch]